MSYKPAILHLERVAVTLFKEFSFHILWPVLKEINPGYPLEGLMLKLKFQYLGHLMRRADSLEKTLMLGILKAGGEGDDRG